MPNRKPTRTAKPRWPKLSDDAKERVLRDVQAWQQDEARSLRLLEAKKSFAGAKTSGTVH